MKRLKLSKSTSHRNALVKNLATSLLLYEKIKTTPAKAKLIQSHVEKLITTAKTWLNSDEIGEKLALYRRLIADSSDKLAVKKLTEALAKEYENRKGGYTRRICTAPRLGDGAEQVVVSLVKNNMKEIKKDTEKVTK